MCMISLHGFVAEALAAPATSVLGGCWGTSACPWWQPLWKGWSCCSCSCFPSTLPQFCLEGRGPVLDGCCQLGVMCCSVPRAFLGLYCLGCSQRLVLLCWAKSTGQAQTWADTSVTAGTEPHLCRAVTDNEEKELQETVKSCWSEGSKGRDLPGRTKWMRGLAKGPSCGLCLAVAA